MFASGLVAESPVPPAELMAPDDNPVEMGEAPEEVPDEPTPADDGKRRRRRRRRRGRKSDDVPSSNAATDLAPAATPDAAELDDGDDDDDDTTDLDDDEDVEPITFTDWNVPTWQELIGSLYRPER